ncbi:MAG: PIN domain-containing protein [Lachnospiraceae bacterium]|nr:PIN domain-containing protein [Erysipelotrichaceae bacterium]MBR4342466.1 PIN domain-containing protein [Lachnospiraceae bacterium]
MKIIFDTCIILDYLLDREEYSSNAEKLIIKAAQNRLQGLITVKSLMDVHYILKHTIHNEEKIREIISTLLDSFALVDSTGENAVRALSSDVNDYEDALMIETAVSYEADGIVTRNLRDYRKSSIRIYNPEELLAVLATENMMINDGDDI